MGGKRGEVSDLSPLDLSKNICGIPQIIYVILLPIRKN